MRGDEDKDSPGGSGDGPLDAGRNVDPWLRRFAARERDAIAETERLVARIVGHRGFHIGRAEREDLVQETMTQVWQAIGSGRFDAAQSFEAFVRTVATRRCIDWRRSRRATTDLSPALAAPDADPESSLLAKERVRVGQQLLAGLGEGCRDLIRLHATEGLAYAEIARRWGRSEGALRVQMSDCLSRARRLLEAMRGAEGGASR
ncbi:MAG TPA: sigma-70 family RNA polymerase sigma factor [Patescibacteria group bacterium]|nr:sigma-70 family RNA polymerase sigma factor [Patescibacteria group bacterium]